MELSVKTCKNPIYVAEVGITAGVTMHTIQMREVSPSRAADDHDGYHWSRCHTNLGHVLKVFMNKAF